MAVTKIFPVYQKLFRTIDYIINADKTAEETLVTYQYCSKHFANEEFMAIINDPRATNSHIQDGNKVLARHLIQSFKPGEIDPFTAHQIGMQLAERHLGGKYQFIVSTHVDKGHIHNHIVFNNVSFVDYHCYNSNKRSYQHIRQLSDQLCLENNLDIIMQYDHEKLEEYPYATESRYKNVYRDIIRADIDQAVRQALDFEDYLQIMRDNHYEMKQGKYLSYRHKKNGQKRYIRDRSLGKKYLKDALIERIDREFLSLDSPLLSEEISSNRLGNIIDLSSSSKFDTEKGLRRWAIKSNNKTFIQTMNEMMRLGIGSYKQLAIYHGQLTMNISELNEAINAKKLDLKGVKKSLETLEQITKLYRSDFGAETYLKITTEIEEVFSQNLITFDYESFDKIKVDQRLVDQIDDVMMEYRERENMLVSELSDLIGDKEVNQAYEAKIQQIRDNYERYMSKDDRDSQER